jgi:hypothetical protein
MIVRSRRDKDLAALGLIRLFAHLLTLKREKGKH